MSKPDLTLNNLQWLVYYKTKVNKTNQFLFPGLCIYIFYHIL